MWFSLISMRILTFCYLVHVINGVIITDHPDTQNNDTTMVTTTYRVSMPKPKTPSNRVPAHLQDVHLGYVYEDADDVIHIIEPPKHFEALKRRFNQRGVPAIWEQQSKIRSNQLQHAVIAGVAAAAAATVNHTFAPLALNSIENIQMKVKEQLNAKVANPTRLSNKKPVRVVLTGGAHNMEKSRADVDLLTQETKAQQIRNTQFQPQGYMANIPMEILASVRKTERLQQKSRPVIPQAKQRVKTHKIQSVFWENGYALQKAKQGQDHRIGVQHSKGPLKRTVRFRRSISTNDATGHNRKREAVKRSSAANLNKNKLPTNNKSGNVLAQINELLKTAAAYLPDEIDIDGIVNTTQVPSKTSRALHNIPKHISIKNVKFNHFHDDELLQILENSVNATDIIMHEIMRDEKINNTTSNFNDCSLEREQSQVDSVYNKDEHFEKLDKYIVCVRKNIALRTRINSNKPSRTKKQTTYSYNPNNSNFVKQSNRHASNNVSALLLYDDIMKNIRNMLQERNLRQLENQPQSRAGLESELGKSTLLDIEPPSEIEETENFRELNKYLYELQRIVSHSSSDQHRSNDATFKNLQLNSTDFVEESKGPHWYLINGADIPNADVYLQQQQLRSKKKVGEKTDTL